MGEKSTGHRTKWKWIKKLWLSHGLQIAYLFPVFFVCLDFGWEFGGCFWGQSTEILFPFSLPENSLARDWNKLRVHNGKRAESVGVWEELDKQYNKFPALCPTRPLETELVPTLGLCATRLGITRGNKRYFRTWGMCLSSYQVWLRKCLPP